MRRMRAIAPLSALFLMLAMAARANEPARINYSVEPSSTGPSATVVSRGGESVVIFQVPSFNPGTALSFTFSMRPGKWANRAVYPNYAALAAVGNGDLEAAFTPSMVTFDAPLSVATSGVTLTLAPGDYRGIHTLEVTILAHPDPGTMLGEGPGVKVVVLKDKKAASASRESGMLQDVEDALAPGAGTQAAPPADAP